MSVTVPAGRWLPLLLALLAVAACRDRPPPSTEASEDGPAPREAPAPADTDPLPPLTPFEAAPVVFDTTEPAEVVVAIPPRPEPSPPRPTPPRPLPPPPPPGPAGSCDVRQAESFCFTYTGTAWTPSSAEGHCREAPVSEFRRTACPVAGRIGTCTFRRPSDPAREIVYTYYDPYDVALAELACPGTFERAR